MDPKNLPKYLPRVTQLQLLLKLQGVNSQLYKYKKLEPLLNTIYDFQLFRTLIPNQEAQNRETKQEFTMFERSTFMKDFPKPKNSAQIYSFCIYNIYIYIYRCKSNGD